jgi:hypothetical protein
MFFFPFTHTAANMHGSLKNAIRFRTDTCEIAPVPSRHTIPAPTPPNGNATLFK